MVQRDWGMDGRRPNPTYTSHRFALEEVIRSLQAMGCDLKHNEAEYRKCAVYISDAEHDLHRLLTSQQIDELCATELRIKNTEDTPASQQVAGQAQAVEAASLWPTPRKRLLRLLLGLWPPKSRGK